AHQLSASRLDSETRGESGGSVQIIYAASLAISLEQFINRVTSRGFHHRTMRQLPRPSKGKLVDGEAPRRRSVKTKRCMPPPIARRNARLAAHFADLFSL